jgi:hypothetical protein
LYDEDDQRLAAGTVTEHLSGDLPISGSTSSGLSNGTYFDQISALGSADPRDMKQRFTVTIAGTDYIEGGMFELEVWAFGGVWGTLGLHVRPSVVFINGDAGRNADGRLRTCQ